MQLTIVNLEIIYYPQAMEPCLQMENFIIESQLIF